jgi:hypothetical protein
MFESLQRIYSQFKSFIKYITCKMSITSEEPYYEYLPEDDIRDVL